MQNKTKIVMLNKNGQFQRVYKNGKSSISNNLVTYYIKNGLPYSRVGITTSKKIGCAVKRNRAKRIIREAFFNHQNSLKPGYDFVFVARGKTPYQTEKEIFLSMQKQFKKENLFL